MAIDVIDSFSYKGKKFLDARQSFETLEQMYAVLSSTLPEGFLAFCKEDKKHYVFKDNFWEEFIAGGSGVNLDEYAKKSELDEFDPTSHKKELQNIIDEARADILTLDKFDEFNADIYKDELNAIVEGARAEFSILDNLTQIDIAQLKEEIKAEILAELGSA